MNQLTCPNKDCAKEDCTKKENVADYISGIKGKVSIEKIDSCLKRLSSLNVLVIGDSIIDRYTFVVPKGRSMKDPILSVGYVDEEMYAGGILAIANNLSDFVKKIKLTTLIGENNSMRDFIENSLGKNIELKAFVKEKSPTTIKQRMIDCYRNNKLFKLEYINDKPIKDSLVKEVTDYLDEELPRHDMVVVGDFGHGFINDAIRRKLEEKSRFLALNVQSNSTNMGYNYFTLYKKKDFLSLNEEELRLPLSKRFEDIDDIMREAYNLDRLNNFLVTQGKKGCTFVRNGKFFRAPAFAEHVKDSVGAGDALFALASLFVYARSIISIGGNEEDSEEIIPFIANCAGGIAVNIMGNKESITKERLLNFIKELIQQK